MKFSEKLLNYKRKQIRPLSFVHSEVELPLGKNVGEKLFKIMESRRVGLLPKEDPIPLRPKRYLAICVVIVDKLHHEEIWKKWLEEGNSTISNYAAELFIHAKYPERIKSPWIRERLIDKSFEPEWNSIEVVRAMLQLISFALHKQTLVAGAEFERIVFLTESCIPVLPLIRCGELLFAQERSWVNAYKIPESTWEDRHCFKAVDPTIIPPKAVNKALPGWIMLTKCHAEEIVALINRFGGWDPDNFIKSERNYDILSAFGPPGTWSESSGGVFAPEEVFFPTMLSVLGYIQEDSSKEEVERRPVVYAEWRRKGDANPITFSSLERTLLQKISDKNAPFARKFVSDSVSLKQWTELVLASPEDDSLKTGDVESEEGDRAAKKQKTER